MKGLEQSPSNASMWQFWPGGWMSWCPLLTLGGPFWAATWLRKISWNWSSVTSFCR